MEQSKLPVHVLAGNFTLMLFNRMAGVNDLCLVKGSVACVQPRGQWLVQSRGQWLVLSQEVSGLFSQGVSGLCSPKGSVACVQSGSSVGACMWICLMAGNCMCMESFM